MAEDYEVIELEYSEDDILYYLVDEDDNEVGFVIEEEGQEVECYYEGFDEIEFELVDEPVETPVDEPVETPVDEPTDEPRKAKPYIPEKATDHGYLHKLAAIAGHEGGKARAKAGKKLDTVRDKAEVHVDKAKATATKQAGKAKAIATEQAGKAKAAADEADLGITREGVKEATDNLNAIAKEGAETAKEFKETYDDIMENFGFLMPKKIRRKLP